MGAKESDLKSSAHVMVRIENYSNFDLHVARSWMMDSVIVDKKTAQHLYTWESYLDGCLCTIYSSDPSSGIDIRPCSKTFFTGEVSIEISPDPEKLGWLTVKARDI